MSNSVCVVIPVHSAAPEYYELISFQQCFNILGKHPIYVVAPEGLDLCVYKALIPTFKVVYINKKWQSSKLNYNKLKMSQYFYNLFKQYTYLLTYELDAFVFTDQLKYWCDKGYDYIGAPWFDHAPANEAKMLGVGNSGFSLRNIKTMQQCLKKVYYVDPTKHSVFRKQKFIMKLKGPIFKQLRRLSKLKSLLYKENATIQKAGFLFEDKVVFEFMAPAFPEFKLAPADEAYKFSFEVNAPLLYAKNGEKLPMGCHAWWLYDLEFWKPFIESYGYKL
ncbi:hypothetical protein DJ568_06235 [Mucilaginibacter hurinus]|uniref:DUF5672 domain-containing protein n=1 Tax=Mucilaginibacter hurinus TaxID=2201324 RepID=A0A367GPV5_9SPHI|nr:DUF5672 family protein [Mucilaginibacter hurinus]RCH55489.1 hypothetical protein DJ568_06235 [Mucilaginibacter hurinus]